MDASRAQQIADMWLEAHAANSTSQQLASRLNLHVGTLYVWRKRAEETLGIELPTMMGSPMVAARERARTVMMDALPPLRKVNIDRPEIIAQPAPRVEVQPDRAPVAPMPEVAAAPREQKRHRKHYIIPDLQLRKGVPLEHLAWIGADIARRKPDLIVLIGDVWDMPSLSSHDGPGSLSREGARYEDDIAAGMQGMELLMRPVLNEMEKGDWLPRRIFCEGNHEYRIMRAIKADPRYAGTIGPHHCYVERWGFERHNFLEVVDVDGVSYSHYFQMASSDRPIGGSMDNRLNKICGTFVQGHEQGLLQHRRPLPIGRTIHGLVCGSAYMHSEDYRGPQRNNEWRGTVVLHDVRNNGDCDPMPLTLQYLAREYGGVDLHDFMAERYPNLPRGWAA